jgi:Cof subfamily protein (haloacid dehalogenase superfamily)
MPRYRLLALDIDGTLVNSANELTPRVLAALQTATDAGIRLVLATGRRYSRALPLVEPLGIDAPIVTASGALIKRPHDHHTLYRAEFTGDLLPRLLTVAHRSGYEALLYGDTFADGFDYYCRGTDVEHPLARDFFTRNPDCHRLWPELLHAPPHGVFAGFCIGTREEMLALHDRFTEELPGELYTHVLRSPRYLGYMCEIAPHGVTKWSGVLKLAAEWDIAPEEICAVGDDVNDIPMIESAGLGVAMGNALEEVRSVADRIAPTCDEDGVATVIDWITAL